LGTPLIFLISFLLRLLMLTVRSRLLHRLVTLTTALSPSLNRTALIPGLNQRSALAGNFLLQTGTDCVPSIVHCRGMISVFSRLGVNEAATIITQLIMDGMTLFIPHSQPAGKKNSPKWFTKKCEKGVRAKNQAYSNWKANTCPVSFQIFKSARNAFKDAIRMRKRSFRTALLKS